MTSKISLSTLLLLFSTIASAQVNDNFSDGDFNNNPNWKGSATKFTVNANKQLQLNGVAANDTTYLTVANTLINNTEWKIWMRSAFKGSTSNYTKIYLVANEADLKSTTLNGYYLKIGKTGNTDGVDLYKQTGKISTLIIPGIAGRAAKTNNIIGIKVQRDNAGNWALFSDTTGGNNYQPEGAVLDNTYNTTSFFGVSCRYSSSNKLKFYFDDISINTYQADIIPPKIDSAAVVDATHVDVYFSESVEPATAENTDNYIANNGLGKPVNALRNAVKQNIVHLEFGNIFTSNTNYKLTVSNVQDIATNPITTVNSALFTYRIPVIASANDVLINEVLFNPKTGGVDFVEIYNRSTKVIDLQTLQLLNKTNSSKISIGNNLFFPGEYKVLTTNPAILKNQYPNTIVENCIKMVSMPSFNDDEGTVIISNSSIELDRFEYSEKMHFALLNDDEGVSLERISTQNLSQKATSWHSAAENCGFATPGYKNSQSSEERITDKKIAISPEIFSPDNDGYNDVLNIYYNFQTRGLLGSITLYDAKGNMIKHLVKNELIGLEGSYAWDGITDSGEKARVGLYLIYFETTDANGGIIDSQKLSCVLGTQL